MRSLAIGIALVAGAFAAGPAAPAEKYESGKFLLEACRKAVEIRSQDRWNRDFCVGFVAGWVEGHARGTETSGSPLFCLPEDATTGKLVGAVVRYLEDHPEALALERGEALEAALADRYPCTAAAESPAR